MIKKIIFIIFCFFIVQKSEANIVGNQATSEDSIAVSVMLLDSLGNPADLSADSFYVSVIGPSGDSIFTRAGVAGTLGLNIDSSQQTLSGKKYIFKSAINSIDGSGRSGNYELTFCAKQTSTMLISCKTVTFQLITTSLNDRLAELESIYDSIKNYDNWVAKESTVQSIDSSSVAGWVWNSPNSNHTTSGTFGDYLDSKISGLSSGSGIYSFELNAYDSSSNQSIAQINIAIRNLDQTSLLAVGTTDSYGRASFNLNSGIYLAIAGGSGYQFNAFDTITVSATGADTLYGSLFNPGTPADIDLCRLYGFVSDIIGGDLSDLDITVSLTEGAVRYDNIVIAPYSVATTTDSTGYFQIDIIPNALLDPSDQSYELTISRRDGIILRKKITVPDQSSWLLDW